MNVDELQVNIYDLGLSIFASILSLTYTFYQFRKEAKFHGMQISEYAISILQLSEISVSKLIPRLPAIRKGLIEEVNFSSFKFDKSSFGPLLTAINHTQCKLKRMKISIGSLTNLDFDSCQMLGQLISFKHIEIIISRSVNGYYISNLFQKMDIDKNGYIDKTEFIKTLKNVNNGLASSLDLKQQEHEFEKMAIRRLKERDKIYFFDFYKSVMAVNTKAYKFDITRMHYPIHGIIDEVIHLIEETKEYYIKIVRKSDSNITEEMVSSLKHPFNLLHIARLQEKFDNLWNLYYFCIGANILTELDQPLENHAIFPLIDAFNQICLIEMEYPMLRNIMSVFLHFLWKFFNDIVTQTSFVSQIVTLLSKRNKVFVNNDLYIKHLANGMVAPFVKGLKYDEQVGLNIFEYCFAFQESPHDGNQSIGDTKVRLTQDIKASKYQSSFWDNISYTNNYCRHQSEIFSKLLDLYLSYLQPQAQQLHGGSSKETNDRHAHSRNKSLESLIFDEKGVLYTLFSNTNGLYMFDIQQWTPFHYACNQGLTNMIDFYCKYIICDDSFVTWINEPSEMIEYCRILIESYYGKPQHLQSILQTGKIDVNQFASNFQTLVTIAVKQRNIDQYSISSSKYNDPRLIKKIDKAKISQYKSNLLSYIEILSDFGCDFTISDEYNHSNIIDIAVENNDVDAVDTIIKCCRKRYTQFNNAYLHKHGHVQVNGDNELKEQHERMSVDGNIDVDSASDISVDSISKSSILDDNDGNMVLTREMFVEIEQLAASGKGSPTTTPLSGQQSPVQQQPLKNESLTGGDRGDMKNEENELNARGNKSNKKRGRSGKEMLGFLLNDNKCAILLTAFEFGCGYDNDSDYKFEILERLLQCPELDLRKKYIIQNDLINKILGLNLLNKLKQSYGSNSNLNESEEEDMTLQLMDEIRICIDENTHTFVEMMNRLIIHHNHDNVEESKFLDRLTKDELINLNEYYTKIYKMIVQLRNDNFNNINDVDDQIKVNDRDNNNNNGSNSISPVLTALSSRVPSDGTSIASASTTSAISKESIHSAKRSKSSTGSNSLSLFSNPSLFLQNITSNSTNNRRNKNNYHYPSLITLDKSIDCICKYLGISTSHTSTNVDSYNVMGDVMNVNEYKVFVEHSPIKCFFQTITKARGKIYCIDITHSNYFGFTSHDGNFYFYQYFKDHGQKPFDASFKNALPCGSAWAMGCALVRNLSVFFFFGFDITLTLFSVFFVFYFILICTNNSSSTQIFHL